MPRDYAKPSVSPRRSGVSKKKPTTPIWLWIVTFIIVIVFISGVIYFRKHPLHFNFHKTPTATHKSTATKISATATTAEAPRFEFYDMLSNTKASAPMDSSAATGTKNIVPNSKPSTVANIKKSEAPVVTAKAATLPKVNGYVLQIASFKDRKPAEQLKAKLSMQGVETTILKLSAANTTWYRVIAGPYNTSVTAEKVKIKLQTAGYKPILHNQSS